jgi:uncharacterized protein YndB with AHSA1/START domain
MDKFTYTIYIATTPGEVWHALTDPAATAQFWGHRNVSGWTKGDRWEHRRLDDDGVDLFGTVAEVSPPRRLAHTWAFSEDAGQSLVTFDIEAVADDVVRLDLRHENLPADQAEGTGKGWAKVLSSLKSLLETGKPLSALM